jgi:hypothetical protein
VPMVHTIKDTDGYNGSFIGRSAGQTLAKAHSWLVPIMSSPRYRNRKSPPNQSDNNSDGTVGVRCERR